MKPRIRTVKPEFYKHEKLFDMEKASGLPARIAWAGLFMMADREGRFEWRPRALKAYILPYDEQVDFARLLDMWVEAKMVYRYEIAGEVYGWIPSFSLHQVINNRESASEYPAHPNEREILASLTRGARVADAGHREGKGKEGNGTEGREGVPPTVAGGSSTQPDFSSPFGEGPFQIHPEIVQGDPATRYVAGQILPATQQALLEKYGAEIINDSLARAIAKKLTKLKTQDPRKHDDWPGYLANWFKRERNVKFKPRAPAVTTTRPTKDPPVKNSLTPLKDIMARDPNLQAQADKIGVSLGRVASR